MQTDLFVQNEEIMNLKGLDSNADFSDFLPTTGLYWPRSQLFSEYDDHVDFNGANMQMDFPMFADSFAMDTDEPEELLSDSSADTASSGDTGNILPETPPIHIPDPSYGLLREDDDTLPPPSTLPPITLPPLASSSSTLVIPSIISPAPSTNLIFDSQNEDVPLKPLPLKQQTTPESNPLMDALTECYREGWTKVSNDKTLPGKKPKKSQDKEKKTKLRKKQPKLKSRWTLFCVHCNSVFLARPTPKNSRYVVNHVCNKNDKKRRQFVLGVKSRRCNIEHEGACVQRLIPQQSQNSTSKKKLA